jgi:hypothetical protein
VTAKKVLEWNMSMLVPVGSIQSSPKYTGGQLMEITWHYENLITQLSLGRMFITQWSERLSSLEAGT